MIVVPEEKEGLVLSLHTSCCAREEHCANEKRTPDEAADLHDGHYIIKPMNMFCTLHYRINRRLLE